MVCFVRYYTPNICSVMAEVSDEADTQDNVSPHAHLKGFIKLPCCLVLNVSAVRLCVTQDGSSAHTQMHTYTQTSRWSVRVQTLLESTDSTSVREGGEAKLRGGGQGGERKSREV